MLLALIVTTVTLVLPLAVVRGLGVSGHGVPAGLAEDHTVWRLDRPFDERFARRQVDLDALLDGSVAIGQVAVAAALFGAIRRCTIDDSLFAVVPLDDEGNSGGAPPAAPSPAGGPA
ncbi:MAG TPA: hypothetical protein VF743_06760 [Acidimicrobiales bacterium]